MRLPSVHNLLHFALHSAVAAEPAAAVDLAPVGGFAASLPEGTENVRWSPARIRLASVLWGDGYQFPGGEGETLQLARPMGLSAASSLLLVGAGAGGPPCSIANNLGGWVTGYEADPDLLSAATERSIRGGFGRRAQIETWDPAQPFFERNQFHHGLALEPLSAGQPEPTLAAVSMALKPGAQFALLATVADNPLDGGDPLVAAWRRLEGHRLDLVQSEVTITRVLGRLGFDVRIAEDVSARHMRQVVIGWRRAIRAMQATKPGPREAAHLIREAELWLLRIKLFRAGMLRLVRWHAILRA